MFFSFSTSSLNSLIPLISKATNLSYLTALYPFSLVVTNSGNIASISWAITPTSCPLLPWIVFCSFSDKGIQSNSYPDIVDILSRAFGIIIKFSFNLLSDVAYATTSFSNIPKPSVVGWVDVKLPTCKAACDTTNFKPSNVKLDSPYIEAADVVPVIILLLPALT